MKLERINENQIKCTLSNIDLIARNINLTERAYGTEKINVLFNELIQKAVQELDFTVNGPFRIEAVPFPGDNMVVIITNVEDPEEVDVRFAKFSQLEDEDNISMDFDDFFEIEEDTNSLIFTNLNRPDNEQNIPYNRIFNFNSLDEVQEAAKAIGGSFNGSSGLYKNPDTGIYTLLLVNSGTNQADFISSCNKLAEYGKRMFSNYSSISYLNEHYDIIIKDFAVQTLINF